MTRLSRVAWPFAVLLATGPTTRAADPPAVETLPAPRAAVAPAGVPYFVPAFQRTNRYEVWQYYAPDRAGRWRPVVVYSPYGAYYPIDGRPYPWATMNPQDWMPFVVD
jgi:hypothetical protein